MADQEFDADVLVVGAGPVGLLTALDLGRHGVRCIVIEAADRPGDDPGACELSTGAVEYLHHLGLSDQLAEITLSPRRYRDIVVAEHLVGRQFTRLAYDVAEGLSPFGPVRVAQAALVRLLHAALAEVAEVEVRWRTTFERFSVTKKAVKTTASAPSGTITLQVRYLVGADGAAAGVGSAAGISHVGIPHVDERLSVVFEAPALDQLHDHGHFARLVVVNDEMIASIRPLDGLDRYQLDTVLAELVDPTAVDPSELLYRAVGVEFPHEIITGVVWETAWTMAEDFRRGPVMVVGDAAHRIMPNGGMAIGAGVGDAANLAWKLAAVIRGWGGDELLDSYGRERAPVAQRIGAVASAQQDAIAAVAAALDEALEIALDLDFDAPDGPDAPENLDAPEDMDDFDEVGAVGEPDVLGASDGGGSPDGDPGSPGRPGDAPVVGYGLGEQAAADLATVIASEVRSVGVDLGVRYDESPICWPDGSDTPPDPVDDYVPTARPGARLPWLTLDDGTSIHDLVGNGLTLFRLGPDAPAAGPFSEAAAGRLIPFRVVDVAEAWVRGAYGAALVIVRPDRHVSWRSDTIPADPGALLDRLRGVGPPLRLIEES